MKILSAKTFRFDIYMAGDIEMAKQVCREYCMDVGFCVHIEPVDFIYTGGQETGFKVGIIHYPRFQTSSEKLQEKAYDLGERLMKRLCQLSFTIVGPNDTFMCSRRDDFNGDMP